MDDREARRRLHHKLIDIQDRPCEWCGSRQDRIIDRIIEGYRGGQYTASNTRVLCLEYIDIHTIMYYTSSGGALWRLAQLNMEERLALLISQLSIFGKAVKYVEDNGGLDLLLNNKNRKQQNVCLVAKKAPNEQNQLHQRNALTVG